MPEARSLGGFSATAGGGGACRGGGTLAGVVVSALIRALLSGPSRSYKALVRPTGAGPYDKQGPVGLNGAPPLVTWC
ncbi:hypothetical protein GCM10022232_05030 [Streptomyces plumbiresistens]|uniref:Uncharacterized protein n=1 Tax=Streptomyces plumbiresistens TaxID=511811 RepID=A0ABP7Q7X4_9ACTN